MSNLSIFLFDFIYRTNQGTVSGRVRELLVRSSRLNLRVSLNAHSNSKRVRDRVIH